MTGCRHHTAVLLGLVGFLLLAPLAAWAQQQKSGGTLRVAWEADVAGFDPRLSPGAQAGYIMGNLFNSLVSIDAELNYVPDLAAS
jgi:ABC-type transport system substrate-binding protein